MGGPSKVMCITLAYSTIFKKFFFFHCSGSSIECGVTFATRHSSIFGSVVLHYHHIVKSSLFTFIANVSLILSIAAIFVVAIMTCCLTTVIATCFISRSVLKMMRLTCRQWIYYCKWVYFSKYRC